MEHFVLYAASGFELAGIAAMVVGSLVAAARYLMNRDYQLLRSRIAHSILLGLELLIAADIIATITVQPNLSNVLVLGLIVLIRTFLSFTLELEATGRFPWQRSLDIKRPADVPADGAVERGPQHR